MANSTEIGSLEINLKIKLDALEKGLETAKKKLQEIENENKNVENSNKSLDASYLALSATAVASLMKISGVIKDCVNEYKEYTQAMSSLQNVSEYTGQSMEDFSNIMNKFGKYMTKSDMATTIKNFSLMGMTAEQTEQMMEALTNSAIRNRNANYTVSEAVKVASDGYKQGLSTLSDSAGVTENLSVMQKKYAESIGKTVGQLTEEEINLAYLNRTMEASAPFSGAMAEYTETLAGKQGEYNQAMREAQVAYAEALEPTLKKIEEMKTEAVKTLGQFISNNKSATAGITTFIVTLGSLVLTITAVLKIIKTYKDAINSLNMSAKALKTTMTGAFVASTAISGIVAIISAIQEQKQAQEELKQAQEEHNKIVQGTIALTETNVSKIKQQKQEMEDYIEELKEYNKNEQVMANLKYLINHEDEEEYIEKLTRNLEILRDENVVLGVSLVDVSTKFKQLFKIQKDGLVQLEDLERYMGIYNKRLEDANAKAEIKNAMDIENMKNEQKKASELQRNASEMQEYLNIIKNGEKETTEYQNAEKKLAEAYSECSTASGINIQLAQDYINAEQAKADQAWNTSQATIQGNIDVINSFIDLAKAAEKDVEKQTELANAIGIAYSNIIPTLTSVLNILSGIGGYKPEEVPGVKPITTPKTSRSSSSKTYSNTRLDNYKKEIEHKKALDQISIRQEISMYEYALKHYTKKAEERMEIREKIYELNKELAQKEKEILAQQTEDYEAYIQQQINNRGAEYDVKERTKDYDKIISMHKSYLNQIMKDERLSLDERKEIYREELQTIRDYEQQKRDLRVEAVDNTVSQLTSAITKELEEMQNKDKEMIDANLKAVEEWKKARINAINEEYDARIEAINKELEALDKAEQQKSRDDEDNEYEQKKKRLEDLISFEHDVTTKANYQKELDKLIVEYQKKLEQRALEDKKEVLNNQKDLLQEEQDSKIQAVEDEAEKQKEIYDKQLTELEEYYQKQINMAQENAEKMLLNAQKNQDNILNLLKKYGNKYEITGQTLGEKLAQGINEGISNKIHSIIQRIQDTIDSNLEAKIREWTSSNYRYESGTNKPQSKTINITQQNYIEQNPELPSETYRKLNNVSQKLAEEFAGM